MNILIVTAKPGIVRQAAPFTIGPLKIYFRHSHTHLCTLDADIVLIGPGVEKICVDRAKECARRAGIMDPKNRDYGKVFELKEIT